MGTLARAAQGLNKPKCRATMGEAIRVMADAEVDHLPVVDGGGRLRGVVTSDAIVDRARLLDRLGDA